MQHPDVAVPVSLHLPSASRERLLALMATGQRQFVLATLDGTVSDRVTLVPDAPHSNDDVAMRLDGVTVDWERGTIERHGRRVSLSTTERRLLACLLDAGEDTVVSRESLIASIWPRQREEHCRNGLAVYVCYLRQKLAAIGLGAALQTVRGVGYRIATTLAVQSKSA